MDERDWRDIRRTAEEAADKRVAAVLDSLSIGVEGERRQEFINTLGFLRDLRRRSDGGEEQADREWVQGRRKEWDTPQQQRIRHSLVAEDERKMQWQKARGNLVVTVGAAVLVALMTLLFTNAPALFRVFYH